MAQPVPDHPGCFSWQVVLGGDHETVFFEI
jgi:hypothetical protein